MDMLFVVMAILVCMACSLYILGVVLKIVAFALEAIADALPPLLRFVWWFVCGVARIWWWVCVNAVECLYTIYELIRGRIAVKRAPRTITTPDNKEAAS